MKNDANSNHCPKCGAAVPSGAAEGLCTRCLIEAAAVPTEAGQPTRFRTVPPPLERVARAFPQLEIIELIGVGGMGAVYRARQPKLDRFVALKVLPEALATDPAFAERFQREGRVLARLNHPNIVSVHDFGQADGLFYLIMEYVDGVNLRQAMRAGRFTPAQALALVPRICEALQYAHDEGVWHRDIKPENILLDARGRVKIADFGIAKLVAEAPGVATLTATGAAVGTPQYMAPEQIEHPAEADHRADIYSLGVVFYELLTGELPLGRFAPPSAKADLDARVDEIVLRALTKERELRQQSAREVKTEVEGVATTWRGGPSADVRATGAPGRAPLWRIRAELKLLLLLALLVLLGFLVYRGATTVKYLLGSALHSINSGWPQALLFGMGVVGFIGLAVFVVRHRAAWLPSLAIPGRRDPEDTASDGLNAALRLTLLGLLTCLSLDFGWWFVSFVSMLGQLLPQATWLGAAQLCVDLGLWLVLPGYLVWRELRRGSVMEAVEFPGWVFRLTMTLVVVAIASMVSVLGAEYRQWPVAMGGGEWLLLTCLACWLRSRLWRALALAISARMLWGELSGTAGLLYVYGQGGRSLPPEAQADPLFRVLTDYLGVVASLKVAGALAFAASLLALLHPRVRASFGLKPRRLTGSPGVPQTVRAAW